MKTSSFVGIKAPNFSLRDQNGRVVKLQDFRGKKVILYFYVRDDTPGCTKEACSFRDNLRKMETKNVIVLGVSPDSADSHKHFADKFDLTFPLLVDEKAIIAKKYGAWGRKNMYGRTYLGIVRSTFIIDENGKVTKQYNRVRVPGHVAQLTKDID